MEITELLLQEPTRPLEAHGNFESWLLMETLNESFKANRRNLFLRAPKVYKQTDLCAWRHGLLQHQLGPVNSNVVEHSLHFHLVVRSVRKVDSDRTSNRKSFCFSHRESHSKSVEVVTADDNEFFSVLRV
jgi:hypothetical protein